MCGASKIIGVDLNPDKEKFGKLLISPIFNSMSRERDLFFLH